MNMFNYMEVRISTNGGTGEEVPHTERKVWGTRVKLWKENMIPREANREL